MRDDISTQNSKQRSGKYLDYREERRKLDEFYSLKRKEAPKGVSLKVDKAKKNLSLQFTFPDTGKRSAKICNCTYDYTGIINSLDKAYRVSQALQRFSKSSEFWEWYDLEILEKKEIENDQITYREIFKILEDKYFSGVHKNTKRKRSRDIISDLSTFNDTYNRVFNYFPDWDKVPTWNEIEYALFDKGNPNTKRGQGTKTFTDNYCYIRKICELAPNSESLLKKLSKIDSTQTIFTEKQSISLNAFLDWYNKAYGAISSLRNKKWRDARESWLWVASMAVLYGLRPSEIASIQNLDKSITVDGQTVYALTDKERNPNATVVIGEFLYYALVSTKTGLRPVNPIPNKELWEKLNIRFPKLPIYQPLPDSKPKTICDGFDRNFRKRITEWECPITQLYAFRHLYNQLSEQYGIPVAIRSRLMGHSETVNMGDYKSRSNFETSLDLINGFSKLPLSYDIAIIKLQQYGINTDLPEVKAILKIIYQCCSI